MFDCRCTQQATSSPCSLSCRHMLTLGLLCQSPPAGHLLVNSCSKPKVLEYITMHKPGKSLQPFWERQAGARGCGQTPT